VTETRVRGFLTRDRELGTWTLVGWRWLSVDGTTPKNADEWLLAVRVGTAERGLEAWLSVGGPHWGVAFWAGYRCLQWHRTRRNCPCYGCLVSRGGVVLEPELPRWQTTVCERCGFTHPRHCDLCAGSPACGDHVCEDGKRDDERETA
jgi:hypothetical protein